MMELYDQQRCYYRIVYLLQINDAPMFFDATKLISFTADGHRALVYGNRRNGIKRNRRSSKILNLYFDFYTRKISDIRSRKHLSQTNLYALSTTDKLPHVVYVAASVNCAGTVKINTHLLPPSGHPEHYIVQYVIKHVLMEQRV